MKTHKPKKIPSFSALLTTWWRAFAYYEKNNEEKGADNLATVFLSPSQRIFAKTRFLRKSMLKKFNKNGIYEYVRARTMHFDKLLQKALGLHIKQIVILGAGFDTRAYRFQSKLKGIKMFELDTEMVQRKKVNLLTKKRIGIPKNIVFISIDFMETTLEKAFKQAGYDKSKKTLFIWEGVTPFLGAKSVDSTLEFVKNNSAHQSILAFDYMYQEVVEGNSQLHGAKELIEFGKKMNEPYLFGIKEESIKGFLEARGFKLINHFSPEELYHSYLPPSPQERKLKFRLMGNVEAQT